MDPWQNKGVQLLGTVAQLSISAKTISMTCMCEAALLKVSQESWKNHLRYNLKA